MKSPLFSYPSYQYQISDWGFKKKSLLNRINSQKFVRTTLQTFESDRSTNKKSYIHYFQDLIRPELFEFCKEAEVSCSMTDCWTVRYRKGDYQTVHNHKSFGVSHLFFMLSMIQKFILPQHLYVLGKIQELIPQVLYVLKISKKVH
jgi:hypothetical protein